MKKYGMGWFNESYRHSLAAKGLKSGTKESATTNMLLKSEVKELRDDLKYYASINDKKGFKRVWERLKGMTTETERARILVTLGANFDKLKGLLNAKGKSGLNAKEISNTQKTKKTSTAQGWRKMHHSTTSSIWFTNNSGDKVAVTKLDSEWVVSYDYGHGKSEGFTLREITRGKTSSVVGKYKDKTKALSIAKSYMQLLGE